MKRSSESLKYLKDQSSIKIHVHLSLFHLFDHEFHKLTQYCTNHFIFLISNKSPFLCPTTTEEWGKNVFSSKKSLRVMFKKVMLFFPSFSRHSYSPTRRPDANSALSHSYFVTPPLPQQKDLMPSFPTLCKVGSHFFLSFLLSFSFSCFLLLY